MYKRTVCKTCGVTSTACLRKHRGKLEIQHRDCMPVTFVIRLKPSTQTTNIVTPELEKIAVHIRSLDDGKLNYAVDVPLPQDLSIFRLVNADERIEEWHTVALYAPDSTVVESATVCESHKNFFAPPGLATA
jgi:hypothetical protein